MSTSCSVAAVTDYALDRPIGLLKMHSTRCAQDTARDAVQIFGGRGITKTGMGRFIEHVSPIIVVPEIMS